MPSNAAVSSSDSPWSRTCAIPDTVEWAVTRAYTTMADVAGMSQYTRMLRRAARDIRPLRLIYAKADAIVRYWPQVRARPADALRFVLADRECDNYTYDISNRGTLAAFLADGLNAEQREMELLIEELETDGELREALNARLRPRPDRRHVALYARRAGWYALVRHTRPRLVVEVGVHDGLGSS